MLKLFRKIAFSDVLIFAGMTELGAGLKIWFGPGPSLTVLGGLVLVMGIVFNIRGK